MDPYLSDDKSLSRCAYEFINSRVFAKNRAYVRRRLISKLVNAQLSIEDKIIIGAVLLVDGRLHQSTLEMMQEEKATLKVIEILYNDRYENLRLNRLFFELLYEVCRVQKISATDLEKVTVEFIEFLYSSIEYHTGKDQTDPYNLAAMKILLALNEQYMIAVLSDESPSDDKPPSSRRIANKAFQILLERSNEFRAFGENLVFLFNRGADRCLQLMMLKFLYLIFTTKETYNYIYLNDLRVLVGIIIRELCDLGEKEETLRNTYLRVLHPLLQNTEIVHDNYKRDEIVALLKAVTLMSSPETQRLAQRCLSVEWLNHVEYRLVVDGADTGDSAVASEASSVTSSSSTSPVLTAVTPLAGGTSPKKLKKKPPPTPNPRKLNPAMLAIRNNSELEIASVSRPSASPPPPPPPRSRGRSLTPL